MARLIFKLLGAPEVRLGEQALIFPTRKTLAVLIYLMVEGLSQTRENLVTIFWPDGDAARGQASLRRTLVHLRHTLGEASPHLIVERDRLGFNFSSDFEADVLQLQAAWTAARAPLQTELAVRASLLSQLHAVALAYRADFLTGFSLEDAPGFDDWASIQREACHRRMSLVFDRLTQVQAEGGELNGAIDNAARWLTHDPLNEAAYRRLMQLHLAADDRAKALRVYETCRTTLARELNANPTPESEALADKIKWMEAGVRPKAAVRSPSSALSPQPFSFKELPFVGRTAEHLNLVTSFRMARRGRTQLVTLEGEPGIGKTRLAREFLGWAIGQGADVWQGRAYETSGRLPYQPLIEALRQRVEAENAPDDLLSDLWLAELSRLLPELRERYPDLPIPTTDEGIAQNRLFEAVARLGLALGQRAPLVVFLDDLQWADTATLDMLQYVARRWAAAQTPIMLLFTLRSESLDSRSDAAFGIGAAEWLTILGRDLALTQLPLGTLALEDIQRLIVALRPEQTPENGNFRPDAQPPGLLAQFGQRLYVETGGQPFFMVETLKGLVERHHGAFLDEPEQAGENILGMLKTRFDQVVSDYLHGPGSSGLSHSAQEMIRARLARLSPAAQMACLAAAVLGNGFDFERLCAVAGLNENDGLSALEELLKRGVLREQRQVFPYVISHDQIREVIYARAGEARRRIFHRRALESLTARAAPPAELTRHALAAGLNQQAFALSLSAGDEAMRVFAVWDAIYAYEQARMAAAEKESPTAIHPSLGDAHEWQHLYNQLGRAYELTHQLEKAQAVYRAMLTLAQKIHSPQLECAALNRLATLIARDFADEETAIAMLHQARDLAEANDDKAGLAETEWNLAFLGGSFRDAVAKLRHGQQALALARELGLVELIARSLNVLAYGYCYLYQWDEVEKHGLEAENLYHALGDQAMEVDSKGITAYAQICAGRPAAGLAAARTALGMSQKLENPWGQANSAQHVVAALLETGMYGEALRTARQAADLAHSHTIFYLLPACQFLLGRNFLALRALDQAQAALLEARAFNEKLSSQPYAAIIIADLCAAYAYSGDWETACVYARQVVDPPAGMRPFYLWLTYWTAIEALLRGGERALADRAVRRFGESLGNSSPRYRIPYLRCLAVVAQWDGAVERAIGYLEEASLLSAQIRLPGEQWPILAALGELYKRVGNEDQGRAALCQAADIVRDLAEKLDDAELRAGFLAAEPIRQIVNANIL